MTSSAVRKIIGGGVLKLEQVLTICPACGEQTEEVGLCFAIRNALRAQIRRFSRVVNGFILPLLPAVSTVVNILHKEIDKSSPLVYS